MRGYGITLDPHGESAHPPTPTLPSSPQTQDFKIRYTSIQRLFILPKANTPHTLVVVSLDPPIRKGQTYYTHVLCQVCRTLGECSHICRAGGSDMRRVQSLRRPPLPPFGHHRLYPSHSHVTIALQFPSESDESVELDITPEQLAAKNEKV